jgi:hypothetical protein
MYTVVFVIIILLLILLGGGLFAWAYEKVFAKQASENKSKGSAMVIDDLERKYQYLQGQYDISKRLAMDILRIVLEVAIALNVIPIIYHDQLKTLFGVSTSFFYQAWAFIVASILFGFWTYFLLFEGYYHQAHFEASRLLYPHAGEPLKTAKLYNRFLNLAHYFGVLVLICFSMALVLIVSAVIQLVVH